MFIAKQQCVCARAYVFVTDGVVVCGMILLSMLWWNPLTGWWASSAMVGISGSQSMMSKQLWFSLAWWSSLAAAVGMRNPSQFVCAVKLPMSHTVWRGNERTATGIPICLAALVNICWEHTLCQTTALNCRQCFAVICLSDTLPTAKYNEIVWIVWKQCKNGLRNSDVDARVLLMLNVVSCEPCEL